MPHLNLTAISRETLQRKSYIIINKKQIQNKDCLFYANITGLQLITCCTIKGDTRNKIKKKLTNLPLFVKISAFNG